MMLHVKQDIPVRVIGFIKLSRTGSELEKHPALYSPIRIDRSVALPE
jgi:hypothetical protein